MKLFRSLVLVLLASFLSSEVGAQLTADPTVWTYEVKKTGENKYDLVFHLVLKNHFHIFSFKPGGDGLSPSPSFKFSKQQGLTLVGPTKEKGKLVTEVMLEDEPAFKYFNYKVDYTKSITVTNNIKVAGKNVYSVCDDKGCLPAVTKEY